MFAPNFRFSSFQNTTVTFHFLERSPGLPLIPSLSLLELPNSNRSFEAPCRRNEFLGHYTLDEQKSTLRLSKLFATRRRNVVCTITSAILDKNSSRPSVIGQCAKSSQRKTDLQVVLVSPQIPGNTGCIARTCAAAAVGLHLVEFADKGLLFHQRSSKQAVSASKRSPTLDIDDEDDDDSDGEDNEILDMEKWMKGKPAGFGGTGKVYDTSLEDRLLEEIKRDQLAQAASKNQRSSPAVKPAKKPGNDVPPDGVEVFVKNLPRKKNVDRDMRAALRSVSGLLHIRPLVSGNEKTREPVCKGLAFLTFATLDDAEEFVERYNGEPIVFGKAEKKIVCELAKTSSPYKEISPGQPSNGPRLEVRDPSSGDLFPVTPSRSSLSVEDDIAVEVARKVKKLSGNSPASDVEVVEDALDGDESLEEDDADLFALEQEIWDELENEEDFELDMELEAELEADSREASASSISEEGDNSTVSDREDIRQEEAEDNYRPQVSGQGFGNSTTSVESRDDARILTRKSVGSLEEKEKKIKELEVKLEELQSQLNKRNTVGFSRAVDTEVKVREQERKIESLENRLLRRAKPGKDTNVSNGKPTSSNRKSLAKKVQKSSASASEIPSKDKKPRPPPQLKLGASSRLKRREREIFTEALSKYSAPSRE